ncbi:MAG: type II toxin-antitoxin system VapC family toxin [Candidatus Rokubacteria bacterium]|nr:type II toxin-antitoxin system VapC family toxin [Candidatus Rokubacteria bacterium]
MWPRGRPVAGFERRRTASDPRRFQRLDRVSGRPDTRGSVRALSRGSRAAARVGARDLRGIYKIIRRDLSEERAVEAVSALRRATIAAVDESLALQAADLSLALGLAMADSLVYATARRHAAKLVTADADFEGLPDTIVIR